MFIATGQDAGSVTEASWSHLTSELDHETKDLTMSLPFTASGHCWWWHEICNPEGKAHTFGFRQNIQSGHEMRYHLRYKVLAKIGNILCGVMFLLLKFFKEFRRTGHRFRK
jgi:hypothetical protein